MPLSSITIFIHKAVVQDSPTSVWKCQRPLRRLSYPLIDQILNNLNSISHLREARHLKPVALAAWSYSCNFASWVVSQLRLILHGTYGNFGHQHYYLIPKLLQRLANNRAITFFWYLRPGKEGSENILMVSRSHSQLLCIACSFFESGIRIYLGFANWRKNNSVEHVKTPPKNTFENNYPGRRVRVWRNCKVHRAWCGSS